MSPFDNLVICCLIKTSFSAIVFVLFEVVGSLHLMYAHFCLKAKKNIQKQVCVWMGSIKKAI